jgi:hypothetical protein
MNRLLSLLIGILISVNLSAQSQEDMKAFTDFMTPGPIRWPLTVLSFAHLHICTLKNPRQSLGFFLPLRLLKIEGSTHEEYPEFLHNSPY